MCSFLIENMINVKMIKSVTVEPEVSTLVRTCRKLLRHGVKPADLRELDAKIQITAHRSLILSGVS
jgi:hypothetical protein